MDPDAALNQIRELTAQHSTHGELDEDDTARLVELVEGLDDWLSQGSFLPTPWNALRSPLKG